MAEPAANTGINCYLAVLPGEVHVRISNIGENGRLSSGRSIVRPGGRLYGASYDDFRGAGSGRALILTAEQAGDGPRIVRT